jgi:hypothetical protein
MDVSQRRVFVYTIRNDDFWAAVDTELEEVRSEAALKPLSERDAWLDQYVESFIHVTYIWLIRSV